MIAELGKKLVFRKEDRILAMLLFVFYLQSLRSLRPLRFNFMFLFEEAAEKGTIRWTVSGNSDRILLSQQH
jgi:hypothetical protein